MLFLAYILTMMTNSTNEDSYRFWRNDCGTQISADRERDSFCHCHPETVADRTAFACFMDGAWGETAWRGGGLLPQARSMQIIRKKKWETIWPALAGKSWPTCTLMTWMWGNCPTGELSMRWYIIGGVMNAIWMKFMALRNRKRFPFGNGYLGNNLQIVDSSSDKFFLLSFRC